MEGSILMVRFMLYKRIDWVSPCTE